MDININKQNSTELTEINKVTGLTPIQEQCAIFLASGETYTAVADKLQINRGTIYKWQSLLTFRCFYNQQCLDYKQNLKNGLFGLVDEALNAIKDCLHSENEVTRLKIATWITDKIEQCEVKETDPRQVLKEKHTTEMGDFEIKDFDKKSYDRDLKELMLDE